MKKPRSRFAFELGAAAALLSLPLSVFAQNPPASAPAVAPPAASAPAAAPAPAAVPSAADGGYLIGLSFGEQIRRIGITNEISIEDITRGLKDALAGKKMAAGEQQQLQSFVKSVMDAITAHNKAAGKEYLTKNGQEKGVKTTASGLQYRVLIPGDTKAASPQPSDTVTVQYRGALIDGTEFDSSYTRGQPATFPVNGVIKGWQEALVMMKPGSKWKVFVPPELGYDIQPRPGIPAGSVLVFEVELQSIKAAAAAPTGAAPAPKSQITPAAPATPVSK
ncbi:MAG TPA: FKBP-type peptidyl-prolyl cis-trans isomerase [Steroidobacteraceae bacterium]|nr:FKBP-type peptidyl-prolyl cis-trans isomerase [Steroidobacteraceae bacterium]